VDAEQDSLIRNTVAKLDRLLDRYVEHDPAHADLGGFRAFQWDGRKQGLRPVRRPVRIDPADLLGIDGQKELILDNTRRFLSGAPANNVLLWGERGTGKSSLVKSLLTAFDGTVLRMVQVLKHDILTIQELYDPVAAQPRLRFIVFIDDLSFEEGQTDYKELKTIMDGGLEQAPDNLLFYATSNRKHLIPTKFSDNESDDIRPGDTVEEKVSLADRFGVRLGFHHVPQDAYLEIVELYARKAGIVLEPEALRREAVRWAMAAGSRNGRTAEQFVRSLGGRKA
jgi:uncharacterized protein